METKIAINDVKCRLEELEGNQLAGGASFRLEHITAIVGELDRLTALCNGYRGERDELLKEAESTLALYAKKGRVTVSRDGNSVQRLGASAEIAILTAESALTRARAEGMEGMLQLSLKIFDICDCKHATHEASWDEFHQWLCDQIVQAAAIRAVKGEQ